MNDEQAELLNEAEWFHVRGERLITISAFLHSAIVEVITIDDDKEIDELLRHTYGEEDAKYRPSDDAILLAAIELVKQIDRDSWDIEY